MIVLDNGKEVNCGFDAIGITPRLDLIDCVGMGHVTWLEAERNGYTIELDPSECIELCDHFIERWNQLKQLSIAKHKENQ